MPPPRGAADASQACSPSGTAPRRRRRRADDGMLVIDAFAERALDEIDIAGLWYR